MKTNYINFAKRYETAYNIAFAALPTWKQLAIKADAAAHKESRLNDELAQAAIEMAENESIELVDPTPVKPAKAGKKIPAKA